MYDSISAENDQLVYNNPTMTILFAAANEGYLGPFSISRDAAAKNIITVGGIFDSDTEDRSDDYYTDMNGTYGTPPSQGPAADGRIKPDVVASYWGYQTASSASDSAYRMFGGTSGATPITAGCIAVITQAYIANHFGNNPTGELPSAALLKGLLIANAYQLPFANANRTQQGWGETDVKKILDIGRNHLLVNDSDTLGLNTNEIKTWTVIPTGSTPLKISLTWTDREGSPTASKALVNDLDLEVTAPNGTVYYGNVGLMISHYSIAGGYADRLNNVENVFIQNPSIGTWTVKVKGYNVPFGPQKFALVVSGATEKKLAVSIVKPNGGEVWCIGDSYTINWTISGGTSPYSTTLEYSTTGINGPWVVVQSSLTTTTYTWTIPSAVSTSTDCFIKATVTDSTSPAPLTDEDTSDNAFTIAHLFSISLTPGWNLISIPLIPLDTDVTAVLSSIEGSYDTVQYYNVSSSGSWITYCISKPSYLNDLTEINHKMGVWLRVTVACSLSVAGIPSQTTDIPLKAGWNLVGYPSLNATRTVATALAGVPYDRIQCYSSTDLYNLRDMVDSEFMRPGQGVLGTRID